MADGRSSAFVERGGLLLPRSSARTVTLSEAERTGIAESLSFLQERIAELELALEDEGWERLTGEPGRDFSRAGLRRITRLAWLNFLKNPLINRGVRVQAVYVWGQGMSFQAANTSVNDAVQAFMDDPHNKRAFSGHMTRTLAEIQIQLEGNLFIALATHDTTRDVRIGTIPTDEIEDIITNPDDRSDPWFYLRSWTERRLNQTTGQVEQVQRKAYYPDWRYRPASQPDKIGDIEVVWAMPVMHRKRGGTLGMKWGVPEVYAALDWAKAYKESLEDDATRSRALARYAYNLTTKGGARGVAAAKTKLQTTLGVGGATESNPPPVTGSTFIGSDGVSLDPVRLSGATLPPDHNRPLRLMVAAALGLPETFFGDADVSNLATSKTLDRPTELSIANVQKFWEETFLNLFEFLLAQKKEAGQLSADADPDTGETLELDTTVDIDFPPILSHEPKDTVAAIVSAATLDGKPTAGTLPRETVSRMLLSALGEEDIDAVLKMLFPEGAETAAEDTEEPTDSVPSIDGQATAEAMMLEAVRDLRDALMVLRGSNGQNGHH